MKTFINKLKILLKNWPTEGFPGDESTDIDPEEIIALLLESYAKEGEGRPEWKIIEWLFTQWSIDGMSWAEMKNDLNDLLDCFDKTT